MSLIRVVREAAEGILLTYSLKHQLTCEGVLQLLSDIRLQTASHPPHSPGYALVLLFPDLPDLPDMRHVSVLQAAHIIPGTVLAP